MAEDLGKRLLGEIEEVGLDEVSFVCMYRQTAMHVLMLV